MFAPFVGSLCPFLEQAALWERVINACYGAADGERRLIFANLSPGNV